MARDLPRGAVVALIGMLAATTVLSQFYRSSLTIIAPRLISELGLTPAALGFANACFFWALLAVQVPVGVLFDRVGARLTVTVLAAVSVAGAVLHAVAASGNDIAVARVLLGIGHGGSFMATVFLISRWYPRARWATALSWVFGLSMIGVVMAGTPLAAVTEAWGWRTAFAGMAVISGLIGLLFLLLVRDDPPGLSPPLRQPEGLLAAVAGFGAVLRLPGLLRVLGLQTVAYAVIATVMGLWTGPYLAHVHGLTAVESGNVLIVMAVANTLGVLVYGPMDRHFNSRKTVAIAGALLTLAALVLLALSPRPPLAVAVAGLVALSAVSAYGIVVVTHCRTFYPERLAGRGATTANMAQLLGCAGLPMLTGLIPAAFPVTEGRYSPVAYQWIFATIAAALAIGLAIYLTSKDAKPRPG